MCRHALCVCVEGGGAEAVSVIESSHHIICSFNTCDGTHIGVREELHYIFNIAYMVEPSGSYCFQCHFRNEDTLCD